MKTKLLFSFLLITLISVGQTPIASFYGTNNASFGLAVAGNPLVHGSGGANQTWNFNQLVSLGSSVHTYVVPTTAQTTTYPGTTTVIVSNSTVGTTSSTSQIFTKNPANVFSITGLVSSGLTANFVTNNATIGTFPMNYGYTNTDSNVAGTFVYTTYNGTFTGTLVTTVDAYGTLTLNDFGFGSYTGNVTRLKTVLNLSLTYLFPNVGTVTQTSYSYYDNTIGTNDPIFRSTTTAAVVGLLGINQTDTTLEKYVIPPLNNQNFDFASLWINNPIRNTIQINSTNPIENATISVKDMLGKTVFTSRNQRVNETLEIPVSLSNGMYLITIQNENGSVTKKIIKG
jgi:hypothetical protein